MKIIFGIIVIATLLFGGYLIRTFSASEEGAPLADEGGDNVSIVDGTQIVTLRAKGGYQPRVSTVKAGIPTILRVNTNGTFDCSSALRIPSMKISENLPANGTTDIALGELKPGILDGTCSMGMYPFELNVVN